MKRRSVLAAAMAAVMLSSALLTACGSGAGAEAGKTDVQSSSGRSDGKTEVSFWTLSTRQNALEKITEKFNSENEDVNVTVSYYDVDGLKNACKVAASSNTLPSMWFNWGGSLGGFYVENGLTYDLTEYAGTNGWDQKFSAGALSLCTLHGKLSGYPTSYNVLDIYYRKDIFEKYGLSVPATFEEFENVCSVLKENGITPISTAGLHGWHVMRFVELLVEHYAGAELHDKLNNFEESWDNEAVVQALTKYQEFCQKDYFPTGFLTADPNDTLMAMGSGTAAMDIQGQWQDGKILQEGLDINNFGTFPFPSGSDNRLSAFSEMTQFNSNLTEKELEAGIRFMDYYYSDENASTYSEYYNLPLPKTGAPMPEGQPNVSDMLEASNENGTFTITDQAFPPEVADVLFNVQDAIANGQMEPEEGAKQIQEAIDAYNSKS
ncbi:extracellular solute-binding protein [Lachnospiraceae bacterium 54-53]